MKVNSLSYSTNRVTPRELLNPITMVNPTCSGAEETDRNKEEFKKVGGRRDEEDERRRDEVRLGSE